MSMWTHINGIITVEPTGRTQAESTYFLETVLSHLPNVTGSEKNMSVQYVIKPGHTMWTSHDELGVYYGYKDYRGNDRSAGEIQSEYYLILSADLRDRTYKRTFKEFMNWLCRLSKRVWVQDILIRIIDEYNEEHIIHENYGAFSEMHEPVVNRFLKDEKYQKDKRLNRFRYLMWDSDPYSGLPLSMVADEYEDPEVDEEIRRREEFEERRINELEEERK